MHDAFARVQTTFFFASLALVSIGLLWVVRDFILALVWAIVLAILFHPLYYRLRRELKGQDSIAALLTMLVAVLSVFVPLFFMAGIVAREGLSAYAYLVSNDYTGYLRAIETHPAISWALSYFEISSQDIQSSVAEFLRSASTSLASQLYGAGLGIASFAAKALVMLYLLFFLLRDGAAIGSRVMRYLPLGDVKELFLFDRFTTTVRAIAKGTLVVALAQGAIGALLLFLGGIPNPILWGILMAFLSLIPAVGPGIVWFPAGVFAFAVGNELGAAIILIGGFLIIAQIDNILRARLVSEGTQMPDALIFLSVLGGLSTFGVSGILLGPVIAALALSLWQLFEEEYRNELIERG